MYSTHTHHAYSMQGSLSSNITRLIYSQFCMRINNPMNRHIFSYLKNCMYWCTRCVYVYNVYMCVCMYVSYLLLVYDTYSHIHNIDARTHTTPVYTCVENIFLWCIYSSECTQNNIIHAHLHAFRLTDCIHAPEWELLCGTRGQQRYVKVYIVCLLLEEICVCVCLFIVCGYGM